MKNLFRNSINSYILIIILFISNVIIPSTYANKKQRSNNNIPIKSTNNSVLVIFDFKNFSCPLSIDSFLAFCDSIQNHCSIDHISGIVTCNYVSNPNELEEKKYLKIIKKQIKGFTKANNIKFSVILDSSHIFDKISNNGFTVIVLSKTK
jgi:hypothetical protein